MTGKLIFGGLLAAGLMTLTPDTASAQFHGRHPGHRGVYTVPVVSPRPVFVTPGFGGGWGGGFGNPWGGGWGGRPVFVTPGFGWGGGFGNPYWGGGFNNFGGFGRPGFGVTVGFGNYWR